MKWLTPPAIGKLLGKKPEWVISLIRAGKLPAINLSDGPLRPRFRVEENDLAAFLASRAVQPPARRGRKPRPTATYTKVYPES